MYMARAINVIHRIVSPSPLPSNVDGDEYNAVFQNSEYEYDLFDAATGENEKKLYSYPTSEIFIGIAANATAHCISTCMGRMATQPVWVSWENGEMVQVLARDDPYTSEQMLEKRTGRAAMDRFDEGESVQVYDLNDGQSYRPGL